MDNLQCNNAFISMYHDIGLKRQQKQPKPDIEVQPDIRVHLKVPLRPLCQAYTVVDSEGTFILNDLAEGP